VLSGCYAAEATDNTVLALQALAVLRERGVQLPADSVQHGLEAARWPGRLERCPTEPRLMWDGSHNLAGFKWQFLYSFQLPDRAQPSAVVLALGRDKDVDSILDFLRTVWPTTNLIVTRSRSERARSPAELAEMAEARGICVQAAPDVLTAVRHALHSTEGPVLLTGSLFAIGEVMEVFGGEPGEML
jgi:dihydrofolate synthase/folylpolyglutamate synthase